MGLTRIAVDRGDSRTITSKRGCTQGGVISPLLWSLVVDDLLEILEASGYRAIDYTDDIAIYNPGPFEETVKDTMLQLLKQVMNW